MLGDSSPGAFAAAGLWGLFLAGLSARRYRRERDSAVRHKLRGGIFAGVLFAAGAFYALLTQAWPAR